MSYLSRHYNFLLFHWYICLWVGIHLNTIDINHPSFIDSWEIFHFGLSIGRGHCCLTVNILCSIVGIGHCSFVLGIWNLCLWLVDMHFLVDSLDSMRMNFSIEDNRCRPIEYSLLSSNLWCRHSLWRSFVEALSISLYPWCSPFSNPL